MPYDKNNHSLMCLIIILIMSISYTLRFSSTLFKQKRPFQNETAFKLSINYIISILI